MDTIIIYQAEHMAVVTFDPHCTASRTEEHEKATRELLGDNKKILCNLAGTEHLNNDWIRWLARLQIETSRFQNCSLELYSVTPALQRAIENLGLTERFNYTKQLPDLEPKTPHPYDPFNL
jgi:anti-anti-sigma regulatory factor